MGQGVTTTKKADSVLMHNIPLQKICCLDPALADLGELSPVPRCTYTGAMPLNPKLIQRLSHPYYQVQLSPAHNVKPNRSMRPIYDKCSHQMDPQSPYDEKNVPSMKAIRCYTGNYLRTDGIGCWVIGQRAYLSYIRPTVYSIKPIKGT